MKLADIAPRLARAQELERSERGITRCWQYRGYHVYFTDPCFNTLDEAIAYRDYLDALVGKPLGLKGRRIS